MFAIAFFLYTPISGNYQKYRSISVNNWYNMESVEVFSMQASLQQSNAADMLFSKVAAEWFSAGQAGWKPSTAARYAGILERYLLPAFGSTAFAALTREACMRFVQELQSGGLSPGTVSTVLSVLKSVLHFAGLTKALPTPDLRGVNVKKPYRPLRVFSPGEQKRLTRYLLQRGDLPGLGIVLALHTGLRVGELCALKWEDISLSEQSLSVRHTLQRLPSDSAGGKTAVLLTAPKSPCSLRTIPIPDRLVTLLRELTADKGCYFLSGTDQPIEPRSMENKLNAALRACGMEPAGFHICRHSFATRCVELGFDTKTLSEILGHASVSITMNRYVHPSMAFKRENMKRLDALLDGSI